MDLHRFCVKFFAADSGRVPLDTFIPIYHRWIQTQAVDGMLIDVADYAHVSSSPGVVLVAHEANYSLDAMEGPFGLLYQRKTAGAGTFAERIAGAFRSALKACVKLETEPELEGKLRFRTVPSLFLASDRLIAPNTDEAFRELRPNLEAALSRIYPGGLELRRSSADPRSRLAVELGAPNPPADVASLLARLA